MVALCYVLIMIIHVAHGAWEDGNAIDRTANEADQLAAFPINTTAKCFNLCHMDHRCESWVLWSSAVCLGRPDTGSSLCILQSSVPPQRPTSVPHCSVTSGVRRAAKGLVPLRWRQFKLGNVVPAGWLQQQLIVMANGLSGHLSEFWDDIMDSVWIGGKADHSGAGHERGPYWLNGMVPLVAMLNATGDLKKVSLDVNGQVQLWIEYILQHRNKTSGWIGPDDYFGDYYWTPWNVVASLLQYADAMPPEYEAVRRQCIEACTAHVKEAHRRMLSRPFSGWSQVRWADWVLLIHMLLDMGSEEQQMLWDAAELTRMQSWDWDGYYARTGIGANGTGNAGKPLPKFPLKNVGGWTMYDHGVNNAMGTKSGAVWFRQSGDTKDADMSYVKLAMQDKYHGQPHGMFAADECFGGRDLNRGIELCAVVEQMYSLEAMFRIQGDPYFLDRLERIAYNSHPGTITAEMWMHQYLQQANEINALYNTDPHVWQTDGAQSTGFGVAPNFGCCTANMQQGWPKLVTNVLLESDGADGKLEVLVAVIAPVNGTTSRGDLVNVFTEYPFGDTIVIQCSRAATNPGLNLRLRVPGWAHNATMMIDGAAAAPLSNGTIVFAAECAAHAEPTQVVVQLNPQISIEHGWGRRAVTVPSATYSPSGAVVSPNITADIDSFQMAGGAGSGVSRKKGSVDIRSGNPHTNSSATLLVAIDGEGHNIESLSFAFRYVAGYSPPAGEHVRGSKMTAVLVDPATDHVAATIFESAALDAYSYDHFTSYSPPIIVNKTGLSVPNRSPLLLRLLFCNNDRNVQLLLEPHEGLHLSIRWSTTAAIDTSRRVVWPPPATNAAAVVRGPLVYAVHLDETRAVQRTWSPFNNTDIDIRTSSQWNYALLTKGELIFEQRRLVREYPWSTALDAMPAVIHAQAVVLKSWTEQVHAAAEPPPSPVSAGEMDQSVPIVLVPYGLTNIRMAALPWVQ